MSRTSSISEGDMSPCSDHEEYDYETDCTTPAASCSGAEHLEDEEVEEFRDREYPQLKGKVYLDHGGATLYAKSLIDDFSTDLISNLYGNPHSDSTPSAVAGHRIDAIRERALRFFKADPEHWDLVFVANATAGIKLASECIRDYAASNSKQLWYGYHRDAHTSLVGIRELTHSSHCFGSDEEVEKWISSGGVAGPQPRQLGLFAFPGQSNMTGRRLPLDWPEKIKEKILRANTYTLLDAAALASTAPLDLSNPRTSADFVALSFYKIFGFPNIGALLVQKASSHVLSSRKYFGGGTVDMIITINSTWHAKKTSTLHDALEDGTLPFHSIFALDHAINVHEKLYGPEPMGFISRHTSILAKQLHAGLHNLCHRNGKPVITIYKDTNATYGDSKTQGATIAFNVLKADGSVIGYANVERAADAHGIYVRSGSLCNPGGVATYLNWTPLEMRAAFASGHRCSKPTQLVDGRPTGVVRVSLGGMSTSSDIRRLLAFLKDTYLDTTIIAEAVAYSPRCASIIRVLPPSPLPKGTRSPVLATPPAFPVSPSPTPKGRRSPILATSPASPITPTSITRTPTLKDTRSLILATPPTFPKPPQPLTRKQSLRNRLRKSLDLSSLSGIPGTPTSTPVLPRAQSNSILPTLHPLPKTNQNLEKPPGRWDSFWAEDVSVTQHGSVTKTRTGSAAFTRTGSMTPTKTGNAAVTRTKNESVAEDGNGVWWTGVQKTDKEKQREKAKEKEKKGSSFGMVKRVLTMSKRRGILEL